MSDTIRQGQYGWEQWQEFWDRIGKYPYKGEKYRTRDRSAHSSDNSKQHRFVKGLKNSRFNLMRKWEEILTKEEIEMLYEENKTQTP